MKTYALIGRKLGHSYSERWFTDLFARLGLADHRYRLCEMESVDRLREWVLREGICGMNITVPFKQAVIPQLDALDPEAAAIGAVNCISVEQGRLVGHNTDAPAFADTLEGFLSPLTAHLSPLILGTGGAARAVAHALQRLGSQPTLVSRHPDAVRNCPHPVIGYDDLPLLTSHLVVNATPVGMHPDEGSSPIADQLWPDDCSAMVAYDLVYNPSPTRFMQQAAARGATTCDGLAMLHRQAELSWRIFHAAE